MEPFPCFPSCPAASCLARGRPSRVSHLVQPAAPLSTASLLPFLLPAARGSLWPAVLTHLPTNMTLRARNGVASRRPPRGLHAVPRRARLCAAGLWLRLREDSPCELVAPAFIDRLLRMIT